MARKKPQQPVREEKFEAIPATSAKSRRFPIIAAAVIIIIGVSVVAFSQGFTGEATKDYGSIEQALQELEAGVAKGKIGRDDYLPAKVYENLPPFPDDLWNIKAILEGGRLANLRPYGQEYYLQPEWYPTWVEEGTKLHADPPTGRYGIWGFGAYPADQGYTSLPGDEFTAVTYFHTSWVIQSYQGMWLRHVFPTDAAVGDVSVSNQNPTELEKYFDVTITPDIFVLGPSFPVFDANWSRMIEVQVQIAENTPPGEYVIGVSPTWPPDEWDQKFIQEYGLKYARSGSTGLGRPFFQLAVEVREPPARAEN